MKSYKIIYAKEDRLYCELILALTGIEAFNKFKDENQGIEQICDINFFEEVR